MADTDRMNMSRALKAQALLNDPEFQEAFSAVKSSILERIEACPLRDKEGLYCLRLELKILQDVKANIQHIVNTGKVIESNVSFLEKAKRIVSGY